MKSSSSVIVHHQTPSTSDGLRLFLWPSSSCVLRYGVPYRRRRNPPKITRACRTTGLALWCCFSCLRAGAAPRTPYHQTMTGVPPGGRGPAPPAGSAPPEYRLRNGSRSTASWFAPLCSGSFLAIAKLRLGRVAPSPRPLRPASTPARGGGRGPPPECVPPTPVCTQMQ